MTTEKEGACPFNHASIVREAREGGLNAGYTTEDEKVIRRYTDMTGCVRMYAAKDVKDTCGFTGFHAVPRSYERGSLLIFQDWGTQICIRK